MVLIDISPVNDDVEHLFMCSICHLLSFLAKCLFKCFCLAPTFVIGLFVFSLNSHIFWICLINFVIRRIFFPFCVLPFHSWCLLKSRRSLFWWSPAHCCFPFCALCVLMLCLQTLYVRSKRALSYFLLEVFSFRVFS